MQDVDETELKQLRAQLVQQRRALKDEIRAALEREGSEVSISLAGRVHDAGDEALSAMLTDINFGMMKQHLHELAEVEHALQRIDHGVYGLCIDCDEPINAKRLLAYPTALRCIECQSKHEQGD